MGRSRREILEGAFDAINRLDVARMREFLTDDYIEEYPQSGERVVGLDNLRAIVENYPGGLRAGRMVGRRYFVGDDEQYVMGPSMTVVHLAGSGDTAAATAVARYPDGSRWYVAIFMEFRGDRIARMTDYFAPELPAPEWRAEWVERIESGLD
jgi:ketosteroid isomerase-like protein